MFEIVHQLTWWQRAARVIDMQRARVLTRWQQLRLAALAAVFGALGALSGDAWFARTFPAMVEIRAPWFEHVGERLEIVRFDFVHRGAVSRCRLVIVKSDLKWSLHCF